MDLAQIKLPLLESLLIKISFVVPEPARLTTPVPGSKSTVPLKKPVV